MPATDVPNELLTRETALAPERILAAPVWTVLRTLRERGVSPEDGAGELADALARAFGPGERVGTG